jgi:hypothetical protein
VDGFVFRIDDELGLSPDEKLHLGLLGIDEYADLLIQMLRRRLPREEIIDLPAAWVGELGGGMFAGGFFFAIALGIYSALRPGMK